MENNKLSGLLGICKKAGKMTVGTDLTAKAVREKGKVALVLTAIDASDNTVKHITNCCNYYKIAYECLPFGTQELGHLVKKGSMVAVVGIIDENFAQAILKVMKG